MRLSTLLARFALLAVVICSATNALAQMASQEDQRVGTHLWARTDDPACPTPETTCARGYISRGTEVTVIGFATGAYGVGRYLQVRFNNGEIGFVLASLPWDTEDPQIAVRKRQEE